MRREYDFNKGVRGRFYQGDKPKRTIIMHLGPKYTPEKLLDMLTPEQVKELQAAIEKYLADKPKSNNKAPDRN